MAIRIAQAGEVVRAHYGYNSTAWQEWSLPRLESLYELAFLRVFVAWEVFLENTFYRYLCGYTSRFGRATPVSGSYYPTLEKAGNAVLGKSTYIAWYNLQTVDLRCKAHIVSGLHETVLASNRPRLEQFSAIRHRIAHGQPDAKKKFDTATRFLSGRKYLAARPGRFLRDWDSSCSPPTRWLESIASELQGLAGQIV